jgi:hypothetical protein
MVSKDEPMISCDNIWFVLLTIFLRIYDDLMSIDAFDALLMFYDYGENY